MFVIVTFLHVLGAPTLIRLELVCAPPSRLVALADVLKWEKNQRQGGSPMLINSYPVEDVFARVPEVAAQTDRFCCKKDERGKEEHERSSYRFLDGYPK